MSKRQLIKWINELVQKNEMWRFYKHSSWIKLASEVLKEQHYECQECLKRGMLTKANTVHHINFVKEHPELALSKYYIDEHGNQQLNLISICHQCHNKIHNRFSSKEQLNDERW